MKRLLAILLIVAVLAGVADLALPAFVSRLVAQGMSELFASNQVSATVAKRPALGMLNGSFDQVNVDVVNAQLDKIAFSEVHAVLTDVQLDRMELYLRRKVKIENLKDIDLSVAVTQEELSRYLNQSVRGIKNARVALTPGKAQVTCSLALGPVASLAITLDGKIVGQGQQIKFVTERFMLNNTVVGNIGGALLAEIPLIDLKRLPFGVGVRDIVIEQGKVTIHTDNHTPVP